ncbi:MAG TPA: glutamate decarboxylase, partial [Thermoleophilia bacterium]
MALQHPKAPREEHYGASDAVFSAEQHRIPRTQLPAGETRGDVAYQIVHDELMLDGNARLNLATFVTTYMDPFADKLMAETFDKNMIDKDEYPQTAAMEMRCVNMISRLWHAPDPHKATGCSTTGSSEAAMLGGLALKRHWQKKRRAEGKPADKPNLVTGINVQVCWDKFANYWDVEMRLVPMEGERYHLSPEEAVKLCDENTIGVVVVLGSTFDGSYEDVKHMAELLDDLQKRTGLDIAIHVDGASGGFVAPFLDPDLEWDFRVSRVQSVNASGHKYGLVYPGVGWAVWRDAEALPEDLIFWVNYLGDNMPTFALNFSRPGSQVVAQYYTFLKLGHAGFERVQRYSRAVAMYTSAAIAKMGPFELLTKGDELPVFAFKLKNSVKNFTVFDVSAALRERGWQVPAYTFPKNRED